MVRVSCGTNSRRSSGIASRPIRSVAATEVVDYEWARSVGDGQLEWSFRDEEVDRVTFGQDTSTFGGQAFEVTDVAHAASNPVGDV